MDCDWRTGATWSTNKNNVIHGSMIFSFKTTCIDAWWKAIEHSGTWLVQTHMRKSIIGLFNFLLHVRAARNVRTFYYNQYTNFSHAIKKACVNGIAHRKNTSKKTPSNWWVDVYWVQLVNASAQIFRYSEITEVTTIQKREDKAGPNNSFHIYQKEQPGH
jgi:hypothetical protein